MNVYRENHSESLEGKVLIASPHLDDPYFNKAIIYICAHDSSGAIGVMINHKMGMVSYDDFLFSDEKARLQNNKFLKNKKFPLMFGGPVNTDMLIALSFNKDEDKTDSPIVHTDIVAFLKKLSNAKQLSKVILAKGVSAWDSQQLEEEIAENAWLVTQLSTEMIFSQKPKDKWGYLIKGMGILKPYELVQYSGNS